MLVLSLSQSVGVLLRCLVLLGVALAFTLGGSYGVHLGSVHAQNSQAQTTAKDRIDYPTGVMRMTFRVFFAGLDVGMASARFHFVDGNRYYVKMGGTSGSAGVLRFFVRWEYDTETWGIINDTGIIPSAHRGRLVFRDDNNEVLSIYKNGVLDYYSVQPPQDKALEDVKNPEYRKQILSQGGKSYHPNAEDILTSLQRVLVEVNEKDDCTLDFSNGVYVYDGPVRGEVGKRKDAQIRENKYSPYDGEGFECLIFGAASWIDDKEYAKRTKAQIDARKTKIDFLDIGPEHLPLLPVRVTYNTDVGGAIKVYLSDFSWQPSDDDLLSPQQWQKTLDQVKNKAK